MFDKNAPERIKSRTISSEGPMIINPTAANFAVTDAQYLLTAKSAFLSCYIVMSTRCSLLLKDNGLDYFGYILRSDSIPDHQTSDSASALIFEFPDIKCD